MSHQIILFEDHGWRNLLPLVYVRPVWELICGRDTLQSRIRSLARHADLDVDDIGLWCRPELEALVNEDRDQLLRDRRIPVLFLNGRVRWDQLPEPTLLPAVGVIGSDGAVACVWADHELQRRLSPADFLDPLRMHETLAGLPRVDVGHCGTLFDWPWQLIHHNEPALREDGCGFQPAVRGRIDSGSYVLNERHVSIGPGTRVKPCVVIDAEDGPVWIGSRVTIMPHCTIQGPACIGDDTLLQPGAVVHAGTTIGPRCKIGGEIESCIIQGFSNKQHDGFLGHSYIGSWVNIAADCINSDLKNTYGSVRVPVNGVEIDTGEMFVGMLMGDYSKAGINVSFPTGAVVGFCSSVFRPISPKFVPSFAWLDADDEQPFHIERGIEIARKVMARRQREFTPALEQRFRAIAQETQHIERSRQRFADAG